MLTELGTVRVDRPCSRSVPSLFFSCAGHLHSMFVKREFFCRGVHARIYSFFNFCFPIIIRFSDANKYICQSY